MRPLCDKAPSLASCAMPSPALARRRPRTRLQRFMADESGIMAPHILVFFFLMLVIGGLSVDVMRFETQRVAVQNTLDRATLAAASLKQSLNPISVVEDYFDKTRLRDKLNGVRLHQGMNFRIVDADATVLSRNYFMSLLDVPVLTTTSFSMAERRITNVEIMLVLDISGSMAGSKLSNLKIAAKEFVDTVKADDAENRISIGLVPYNAQVNAGPLLRDKFNFTHNNGNTAYTCVEFPTSSYSQLGLSRNAAVPMMAVADVNNSGPSSSSYSGPTASNGPPALSTTSAWCDGNQRSYITMPTTNGATVKTAIDRLTADGNTSIAIGMKWGTILLDPQARSIYDELITARSMDAGVSGRPFDYDDRESVKVIVLMTDGSHVAFNRVKDEYKSGLSPIYRASNGNLSFYYDRANTTLDYYTPHNNSWTARAFTSSTTYSQLTWVQVWQQLRVNWIVNQLYVRPVLLSRIDATNTYLQTYASASQMDDYLVQNCQAARAQNVLIYAIAFSAPTAGQRVMQACASNPNFPYYIEVATIERIRTAFAQIASNLSKLRLTQ